MCRTQGGDRSLKLHDYNPFRHFTKWEWGLWIGSLVLIAGGFLVCRRFDWMILSACLLGATSLIFVAKGNVVGQFLAVAFGLLYGCISMQYHYYGEMITYVFMSVPIAIVSIVTWLRHPYQGDHTEVAIRHIKPLHWFILLFLTAGVTAAFYFLLRWFGTANLLFSTISVTTSFSAASLLLLRSPFYAIAYSLNDIVLIVLWILATVEDISYLPMILCFVIFLVNDLYGFFNWQRMHRRQTTPEKPEDPPT